MQQLQTLQRRVLAHFGGSERCSAGHSLRKVPLLLSCMLDDHLNILPHRPVHRFSRVQQFFIALIIPAALAAALPLLDQHCIPYAV
eukprot:8575911-Lingulodinium_polyedra.AAC.1